MDYIEVPFDRDAVVRTFLDLRPDVDFGPRSTVTDVTVEESHAGPAFTFSVTIPVSLEHARKILAQPFEG